MSLKFTILHSDALNRMVLQIQQVFYILYYVQNTWGWHKDCASTVKSCPSSNPSESGCSLLVQGIPSPGRQMEPIKGEVDAKTFGWDKKSCLFPFDAHCEEQWLRVS